MTTDNFCFHLPNGLTQTSQTGGQWYSDTSAFSIPWSNPLELCSDHFPDRLCWPGGGGLNNDATIARWS